MNIGFYDPYLDTLGGGEKYILDIISCLQSKHEVTLFWDDETILKKIKDRFGIDTQNIHLAKNIFASTQNFIESYVKRRNYDYLVIISDGSIPFLPTKNIIIFQHPIEGLKARNLKSRLKLYKNKAILCYSQYVKNYLDTNLPKPATILYPAIDIPTKEKVAKEDIILSVGRFTKGKNAKKQEAMIDVFKKNYKKAFLGYKLYLIGSVREEDESYFKKLLSQKGNAPIEIISNVKYSQMQDLYSKAKIYWHAAGFDEDLEAHPERAEHFGIATVEAMKNGAVPVVFNAGGQVEIIGNTKCGFLWQNREQLVKFTSMLINNPSQLKKMSQTAQARAEFFSESKFCDKITGFIK